MRNGFLALVPLLAPITPITPLAPRAMAANPTADEQLWLEYTNRMRMNPQRELALLTNINPGPTATWANPRSDERGIHDALVFFNVNAQTLVDQWARLVPAPPLAFNSNLHHAAALHNDLMIVNDAQEHQLPGEPLLGARVTATGYSWDRLGENIFAYAQTPLEGHGGFAIDWGFGPGGIQSPAGHRDNIMNPLYREVGIAIAAENNPITEVGPLVVTQDFGRRLNSPNFFITGVLYTDAVSRDFFYTPGEGLGNVQVTARKPDGTTITTTTTSSGGYAVALPNGTYDLTFSGGPLTNPITYDDVLVRDGNVKLDSLTVLWPNAADPRWTDHADWSAGIPRGPGTHAVLLSDGPGARTVQLDQHLTTGHITFAGPASHTIAGVSTLRLESNSASAPSSIRVSAGQNAITARLEAASDLNVTIDSGAALTLESLALEPRTLTRAGPGTLTIRNLEPSPATGRAAFHLTGGRTIFSQDVRTGTIAISHPAASAEFVGSVHAGFNLSAGTAALLPGGNKTLVSSAFAMSGGRLDLNDNFIVVRNSAVNAVRSMLSAGRNAPPGGVASGRWNGSMGIVSTTAAAVNLAENRESRSIGYAINRDNALINFTQFGTEPVSAGDLLLRSTLNADANLDGRVDNLDITALAGFYRPGETGKHWFEGDFNYDGFVDNNDITILAGFYGRSLPATPTASLTAVPEPTLSLLALPAILLLRRRQRRPHVSRVK